MREISFRGKRLDNNEWEYGYLCRYGFVGKEKYYIIPYYASDLYAFEVDSETVEQFTGLTDKNGEKIFEGDILKCLTDDFVGTVIYNKNTASFIIEIKDSNSEFYHYSSLNKGDITRPLQLQETVIIGNIRDNPELLEVRDASYQDFIKFKETYEEIKEKIKEAVG